MKMISTDKAAKPLGHYSQAVVQNGFVFLATQLGIDPSNPQKVGNIEEQTKNALNNVKLILEAAGSDLSKILKVTIFISDMNLWDQVNKIYSDFFGTHRPARGVIPTKDFHKGFQVAIDVIASL